MKLIINADDFGYSLGVNHGIIDSFKNGIVTATTILNNMPGSSHAYDLAKKQPDLDVGVHLTLDLGKPLLPQNQVSSLVDEKGNFKKYDRWLYETDYNEKEIYTEWREQIEAMIQNGLSPTHLDSHHHIHMIKPLFFTFTKLAKEYDLAIRFHPKNWSTNEIEEIQPEIRDLRKANIFINTFYDEGVSRQFFKNLNHSNNNVYEMMCHPAYLDSYLVSNSSYLQKRLEEVDILSSDKTRQILQDNGIELISFNDL